MKKRFGFASLFLSLFLLVTMIGCSGGAAPVEPVVPGNTENTYDFKLVSANADSVTVSWKKDTKSYSDENHVSLWIVSTDKNETYDSASYDQKKFNLSTSPATLDCTLKNLSPDTEYTIYLLGYDFDSNYNYTKKICEFSLTAKTAKKDYFSSVYVYVYDEYVSLSWNRSTGFSTASKIVISKKTDEEEDFTKVVEVTDSSSSYSDRNFEFETKYTYKFEAFDAEGKLIGSKTETVTTKAMPVPSKITSITAIEYIDGWELSWAGKPGATKYVVGEFTSSSSTEPVRTWEVTEPSFFYSRDITKSADVYIKIDVYNPKGNSGYCSDKHIDSSATASSVSVKVAKTESSQTSVKVTCSDINVKKAKVEYAVKDYGKEYFMCEYQESKELEVEDLPFAAETKAYVYAKITYNTPDGEEKTYETSSLATLKTKSFAAMEKPVVESVTRSSATVSFKLLTEEQLYGVDPSKVRYTVTAYKEGSSYSSNYEITTNGTTDSLKITGLTAGTKYQYTVYAYVNGSSIYGDESEKSDAVPTKAALSKPVIKTIEEVSETEVPSPLSVIGVTFDPIEEDTDEEIMYGLEWEIFEGSANAGNYAMVAKDAIADTTDLAVIVNGGNRYFVALYAYSKDEGFETRVRSEPEAIQLKKVDDTQMLLGLYYTEEAGPLYEGQISDITNSKTWGGTFTPKSTTSTYSWGLMSKKGNYVVKFGLNSDMMAKTSGSVYLYYVQQYSVQETSKIGDTTLSQGTTTYFVAPDAACTSLVTFADYSSSTPLLSDPWRMPRITSAGKLYSSSYTPEYRGINMTNLEKYMFNNGLYVGIYNPSTTGASVGVSYRY